MLGKVFALNIQSVEREGGGCQDSACLGVLLGAK